MGEEHRGTDNPYSANPHLTSINKERVDLAKQDILDLVYPSYPLHKLHVVCFI